MSPRDNEQQIVQAAPDEGEKGAPFFVVESYKKIRTNLRFLLAADDRKVLTFSSSVQAEGKSTTAVNTAVAFSQLGVRVLLIDADLRRPTIYKKMRVSNSKGLTSVLVGFSTFAEAVHQVNPYLDVLVSGPTPPNPSELLGSDAMARLLDDLATRYDYIFIDTPPINLVSDALVLAPRTSGIVLVLKADLTTHDQFKKAVDSVKFSGARLLGAILNGSKEAARQYRHNPGYGYHYE